MNQGRLKIWMIVEALPAVGGGAGVRNYQLAIQLAHEGHLVSVFCIANTQDQNAIELLKSKNVKIYHVPPYKLGYWDYLSSFLRRVIPYMTAFRMSGVWLEVVRRLEIEKPDVIQLEQVNGYYMVSHVWAHLKESGARIVLDAHNVEQEIFSDSIRLLSWPYYLIGIYILPNFRRIENSAIRSVDVIVACSEFDASFFRGAGGKRVIVVPNGVDIDFYCPIPTKIEPAILFIGGASYPPNADALEWFYSAIYPYIKKQMPSIKWYVIGKNPPAFLVEASKRDSNIIPLGFVLDTRDFLARSAVCISPMRKGSGTSLKILEYLAMGRPVVSTAVGVRGIACQDGVDVKITETPIAFAEAVLRVVSVREFASSLGRRGRLLVEREYSWSVVVSPLLGEYEKYTPFKV